ncbi:MAG TPA: LysR family transcriptional regulator [Tardiphaga sp.]
MIVAHDSCCAMIPIDPDVSVAQLRCFIAVVEAGSVADAGRRLGTSAASVSKAIARLEENVGARLLHRSTHALSLTEDGEALLEPARQVVRAARHFQDAAADAGGGADKGIVRVSAPVAFVRHVLAPLVAEFARVHPEIRLDVRASNEIVDLAEDGIDLALRSGPLAGVPGHRQQAWFSYPWVICAAPDYLTRRPAPRTPDEIDGHDIIGFRNRRTGQVQGWPIRTPSGPAGKPYPADVRFAFDDGDAVWNAMLGGAGMACAPLWLAASDLRSGRAIEVLRDWRDKPVSTSMLRRERELTPGRVAALMGYLRTRAPQLDDLM